MLTGSSGVCFVCCLARCFRYDTCGARRRHRVNGHYKSQTTVYKTSVLPTNTVLHATPCTIEHERACIAGAAICSEGSTRLPAMHTKDAVLHAANKLASILAPKVKAHRHTAHRPTAGMRSPATRAVLRAVLTCRPTPSHRTTPCQ
jgi:hypothetical protein